MDSKEEHYMINHATDGEFASYMRKKVIEKLPEKVRDEFKKEEEIAFEEKKEQSSEDERKQKELQIKFVKKISRFFNI